MVHKEEEAGTVGGREATGGGGEEATVGGGGEAIGGGGEAGTVGGGEATGGGGGEAAGTLGGGGEAAGAEGDAGGGDSAYCAVNVGSGRWMSPTDTMLVLSQSAAPETNPGAAGMISEFSKTRSKDHSPEGGPPLLQVSEFWA